MLTVKIETNIVTVLFKHEGFLH